MDATTADRKKELSPFTLAVVGVILVVAVALRVRDAWSDRKLVMAEVTIRGRAFTVEVADTPSKLEKGLGDRDAIAADRGMYFPFTSAQKWVFWMKGMRFPIDIVWIRDGKIVDVAADVPPPTVMPLETYTPIEPADAVLELKAGTVREADMRVGDEVQIRALP